jgi:hypothetical protein
MQALDCQATLLTIHVHFGDSPHLVAHSSTLVFARDSQTAVCHITGRPDVGVILSGHTDLAGLMFAIKLVVVQQSSSRRRGGTDATVQMHSACPGLIGPTSSLVLRTYCEYPCDRRQVRSISSLLSRCPVLHSP